MILRQIVIELFESLPAELVLHTSMHYSIAFYSRREAASDVISGWFLRLIVPDNTVEFRDSR